MITLPGGPQAYGYVPRDIAADTELGSRVYLHLLMAEIGKAQFLHAVMRWRMARRRLV